MRWTCSPPIPDRPSARSDVGQDPELIIDFQAPGMSAQCPAGRGRTGCRVDQTNRDTPAGQLQRRRQPDRAGPRDEDVNVVKGHGNLILC
jgi:hypothetical protein